MRARPLALLLLLVIAPAAIAHTSPAAPVPPEPPPEVPAAPAKPAPKARPAQAPSALQRIPRITAELVLGGASAAGMAYGGYQLGCALSEASFTSASCASAGLYGGVAGLALGIPIGVMLGGALLDGDGAIAPTVFGTAFGLAAMVGGFVFLQRSAPEVNPVPLVALPLVFAVVGYELSSHDSRAAAQAETRGKRTALQVIPSAAIVRGGFALGVLLAIP